MSRQGIPSISDILERIPPGERADGARALVERAYAVAERAHTDQTRKTGGPYIQHPLAVAFLLADLGMDPDTIAAGLLHDVVEDTDVDLEILAQEFGPDVASLVDGVTKLEQIEQEQIDRFNKMGERLRDEQESESLRKMFIAMAEDIRVVIIKLADRLHNMRTLDPLPPERRKTFARETLEIFAPLANRLGVWQWKWELEDLSLRHLDPTTYAEIASLIKERRPEREAGIQRHVQVLKQRLTEEDIEAEITGRPKHIYSIYNKMGRKGVPFQRVYDVRGIRVITQTVPECYRVLGIVHGLWKPIPGEFDDYIATPKENLYQSLHTAVVGDDGNTLEVQIRTWEMHRTAEYGIAAHWRYKESGKRDEAFEAKIAWLRSLLEWRKEVTDASEFVDAMKTDIFRDRVYTFTPKGKLIDLPVDATPIDFAYHVHTEIGHRCRGARVNGKLVSLDYQLRNGDQVEILTARRGGPSRDWLNPALGLIKTSRARNKIRQWFRRQDRQQNIAQGRDIVERELKRLGVERLGHEAVAQLFGYEELGDFYAAVGFGDIHSQQIVSRIAATRPREEAEFPLAPPPPVPTVEGIQVQGTGGLLTRLARCCHPLPGDDIIGYVTRGRGVTIHRRDCPNILRLEDTERLIEVSWGTHAQTVPVTIHITAYDRARLLSEISNIIGAEDINISAVKQDTRKNLATIYITIEVNSMAQLSRVLTKIERLPNVIEARRHTG
ncbi:MAG TPA: bifunctional (p)ppGpp synthetase/guanosine-3',5'-bis(diphosphate) 3'-pyrophosphohydrolase [Anaerolineae bacterium]|nr:bifunctional (p)ppGpp synthetase/guanosine-3',5'-bis(diphosphate) 3'-pyrophosphohydrolase [Anaerolineae bacterium]